MKKKLIFLLAFLLIGTGMVTAQTLKRVTGIVISEEDNGPVIGASVVVKGTTIATATDVDGKFVLDGVPSSSTTLVISFIGMQTQEADIKSEPIRVVLKVDAQALEGVMVVAFGTQKKSSFTGSATVVDTKELSKHITTNVVNALVGTTPGLQVPPVPVKDLS